MRFHQKGHHRVEAEVGEEDSLFFERLVDQHWMLAPPRSASTYSLDPFPDKLWGDTPWALGYIYCPSKTKFHSQFISKGQFSLWKGYVCLQQNKLHRIIRLDTGAPASSSNIMKVERLFMLNNLLFVQIEGNMRVIKMRSLPLSSKLLKFPSLNQPNFTQCKGSACSNFERVFIKLHKWTQKTTARPTENSILDQTSMLHTLYLSKLRAVIKENTPLSSSPSTLITVPTVVCPNIRSENPLKSHCVSSR